MPTGPGPVGVLAISYTGDNKLELEMMYLI
jgi:hypothetical protein